MKRHRRVSLLITVDGSGKAGWSVKHPQAFIAEHHPKVLPIGQVNRVAHATAADKLIITGRGQLCHEGYPAVSSCPAFGTQTVIPLAYGAKAEVCEMYFPTRTYEQYKLPAGKYRTLRITLGEAEGKNWWCVVFPALCVPGASDLHSLPEGAGTVISQPEKFEVKFKAAELFNQLLKLFDE